MTQLCVKCNEDNAIILIGTNGSFCRECFMKYFTHKFRAALGKNPVVRHGDKVAVAFSGGNSSSALLHVMIESLSPAAFKKLKFEAGIIFVDESVALSDDDYQSQMLNVKKILEKSGLPFHIIKLEEVLEITQLQSDQDFNDLPGTSEKFKEFLTCVKTLTSKVELLYKLRCKLLACKAKQLGYKHVFLGETSTRLAVNILSNLAQGRGSQLASDTRFTDEGRYFGINLLRPMRDISLKEVAVYNNLHKIQTVFFPNLLTKMQSNSSIQRLTEDFVVSLSANFPATETTVFRTSNKIALGKHPNSNDSTDSRSETCHLCHGKIVNESTAGKASALKAIDFTEKLSLGKFGTPGQPSQLLSRTAIDMNNLDSVCETAESNSVLCYSCAIIKQDLPSDDGNMKEMMERVLTKKLSEREMEDKLNGILLED